MSGLWKSMLVGAALLTGTALAAQAQSNSASPPAGGVPEQSARTQPYGSTQSFYPKPGGGQVWKETHYRPPADYATNRADHPYSMHGIGPQADTPWMGAAPQGK